MFGGNGQEKIFVGEAGFWRLQPNEYCAKFRAGTRPENLLFIRNNLVKSVNSDNAAGIVLLNWLWSNIKDVSFVSADSDCIEPVSLLP